MKRSARQEARRFAPSFILLLPLLFTALSFSFSFPASAAEDAVYPILLSEGALPPDAIVVDYASYSGGVVNRKDYGYAENVTYDGKLCGKFNPNPDSVDGSVLKIDGWSWEPLGIDLSLYKYVLIEYKYVSPSPKEGLRMELDIKTGKGNILKEDSKLKATAESVNLLCHGAWSYSLFDLTLIEPYLEPSLEKHILTQMHFLPFGQTKLYALSGEDTIYAGKIIFLRDDPREGLLSTVTSLHFKGAAGEVYSLEADAGTDVLLPDYPFGDTRDGYEFAVWRSEGSRDFYRAGDTVRVPFSPLSFTAVLRHKAEALPDFVALDFSDYSDGNVNRKEVSIVENTVKDGVDCVKITPCPSLPASVSNTLKIDGYHYDPASVYLDAYKYLAVQYYYETDAPVNINISAAMKTGDAGIFNEADKMRVTAYSGPLVPNEWAYAVLDFRFMDEMLNPSLPEHLLHQMHLLPFGEKTLQTLSASDSVYIGKLIFSKEMPEFSRHASYMEGYGDGTFRPFSPLSRAEGCTVAARLLADGLSEELPEVSTGKAWYEESAEYLAHKGILPPSLYSGNALSEPDKDISRNEYTSLLVWALTVLQDAGFSFGTEPLPSVGAEDSPITRAEAARLANLVFGRSRTREEVLYREHPVLFIDVDADLALYADICEATVGHVEADNEWVYAAEDPLERLSGQVDLTAFLDTSAGNEKIAELDTLEASRIAEIRITPSDYHEVTGTLYYVSESGNDGNSGLSPALPLRTAAKANSLAKKGDGILFERGGFFREKFTAKSDVTYSAYGEGAKPVICGSPYDAAKPELWVLAYGEPSSGVKIWKHTSEDLHDVGEIFFDGGTKYAYKEIPSFFSGRFVTRENTEIPFDYTQHLCRNLSFVHLAASVLTGDVPQTSSATGPLYLRCDEGNPGEVFASIEFCEYGNAVKVGGDDVTIDNLCILYTGSHGIGAGTVANLTVRNCEIGHIGGSAQHYNGGNMTRYGNGVEVYGGCDSYVVENCHIYDCYDAGVTHQVSASTLGDIRQDNVVYRNNLITDCVYSVEYFLDAASSGESVRCGNGVLIEDNILRRAGFGFGSTRPNTHVERHIRTHNGCRNEYADFVIRNNIFDRSVYEILNCNTVFAECLPDFSGNTYIVGIGNGLCHFGVGAGTEAGAGITSRFVLQALFGDEGATLYYTEGLPYYEFPFS